MMFFFPNQCKRDKNWRERLTVWIFHFLNFLSSFEGLDEFHQFLQVSWPLESPWNWPKGSPRTGGILPGIQLHQAIGSLDGRIFSCQRISKKGLPKQFSLKGMESTWNPPGIQESTPESLTWIWLLWLPQGVGLIPTFMVPSRKLKWSRMGGLLLTSTYTVREVFFVKNLRKTWNDNIQTHILGDPMIFRVPCFFLFLQTVAVSSTQGAQAERTQCTTRLWSFEGPTREEVKKTSNSWGKQQWGWRSWMVNVHV